MSQSFNLSLEESPCGSSDKYFSTASKKMNKADTNTVDNAIPRLEDSKSFDERSFGTNQAESIEDKSNIVPHGMNIGDFEAPSLFSISPKLLQRTNDQEEPLKAAENQHEIDDGYENTKVADNAIDRNKFLELFDRTLNQYYNEVLDIDESNTFQSDLDSATYELEKFERNDMIIFNHENFMSERKRRGTSLDVAALENTFKQYRFHVTTYNDLTENNLFVELKKFSRRDFSGSGCICVAILTHGQDHGYLRAYDTRYWERDVIACFDARLNSSLVAKPIIFLIQACRGHQPAAVVEGVPKPVQTVELDAVERLDNYRRPMDSDIIMFHSSFFGRASIRVIEEGTWFIQTLCKQIRLHAATDHFEKLCRRVRSIVAEMEYEGAKQMPVVTTTLLKKLYLKRTPSNNCTVT
ncbi:caspase-6-like isoform X2 [Cydia pomonella]|uniref:caspase-6-like isoform X2 n=1 Tax=Cydia pomonella TaxID=82600 RepID=UPI002ADDA651|nr:caspase-6-like isoform X2 [Cydia pomonella]